MLEDPNLSLVDSELEAGQSTFAQPTSAQSTPSASTKDFAIAAAAAAAEEPHTEPSQVYKLVFDNIDKTVTPRAFECPNTYVQNYSVKCRIDFSSFSLAPKASKIDQVSLYDTVLPSKDDYRLLKQNFSVLVARVKH